MHNRCKLQFQSQLIFFFFFMFFISLESIRTYKEEDVIIQLPGDMTVFNIDWLSIFDVKTKTSYGSVIIPDGLNVPPSLVKVINFFFSISCRLFNFERILIVLSKYR